MVTVGWDGTRRGLLGGVWTGVRDEEAAAGVGFVGFIVSELGYSSSTKESSQKIEIARGWDTCADLGSREVSGNGVSFRREICLLLYSSTTASNIESPDPKAAAVPYVVAVQAADNTERAGMREH